MNSNFIIGSILCVLLQACIYPVKAGPTSIMSIGELDQAEINRRCDESRVLYSNLMLKDVEPRYLLKSGEVCYVEV